MHACTQQVGGGGRRAAFENCMQLDPSLSVAWTVNRTSESVEFLLCGCTSTGADQWVFIPVLYTQLLPQTPSLPLSTPPSTPSFLPLSIPPWWYIIIHRFPEFTPSSTPTGTTHGWDLVSVEALNGLWCVEQMQLLCGLMKMMDRRPGTTFSHNTLRLAHYTVSSQWKLYDIVCVVYVVSWWKRCLPRHCGLIRNLLQWCHSDRWL